MSLRTFTPKPLVAALALVSLLLAGTLSACGDDDSAAGGSADPTPVIVDVEPDGTTVVDAEELAGELDVLPVATDLSQDEIDGLVFMREEEKLARDAYLVLADYWDLRVFENISEAEQTHMDSVATLLERYGIADPAATTAIGEFTDPTLQALYDELIDQGKTSEIDALRVGALIEETDILDLRARASEHADIALVYDNLERGSRNHLRAFVRNLAQRGVAYEPVLLDEDEYLDIIGGSVETGGGTGSGGGTGAGRGRN